MPKLFVILLFVVLSGGAGWYVWSGAPDAGTKPPAAQSQGMSVSVIEVSPEVISLRKVLPARVSPYKQAEIRPQVDGIITERLFEEGADVKKGQQLYQIDDKPYRAVLASREADLKSANANIKSVRAKATRYKDLVKINAVSKQEYDDVMAQLDQAKAAISVAKAAIDVAQVNVDYTKVYAPIAGRIGKSVVTEGALVTGNQAQSLAVITQLDPIYIDMTQPGVEAMRLRMLMAEKSKVPVHVIMDNETGLSHLQIGTLKFSDVTVNETTGSVALRAVVPNPDYMLLPGLFVHAELDMGQRDVLLIPQRATVRSADGGLSIWVVDQDNKAKPRAITVGSAYQDQWIIDSGLSAGEKIVIEGYQKISSGSVVVPSLWRASDEDTNKETNQGKH